MVLQNFLPVFWTDITGEPPLRGILNKLVGTRILMSPLTAKIFSQGFGDMIKSIKSRNDKTYVRTGIRELEKVLPDAAGLRHVQ
jgi:hypothetical protein